jgi:CDP-diacylglycerol--glycerol-3-phosphate 3-phosphatidyltransferase
MRITEAVKPPAAVETGSHVHETRLTLANLLTFSRILLIPVFVALFINPTPKRSLAAAVVFVIAAVTDMLDGYIARRRGEITKLGRLLDPIADKLLVLSGLILLVQFDRVIALVAILIIAREVAVTGVRAIAASEGVVLEAETIGKWKMAIQVIAIVLLILEDSLLTLVWPMPWLHWLGTGLLYIALILGLVSGGQYLVSFWQQVASKKLL